MQRILLFTALMLLVGCARYEFDVVRPPEFGGHVGTRTDYTFEREPLEYRLRTVSGRLVMRIYNPTDDAITLVGPQSSIVDPRGESHPLRTQTMAPNSYIRLVLPPQRPRVYRSGPTFGVGVGTRIGRAGRTGYGAYGGYGYDPAWDPVYLSVVDPGDTVYWEWPGEGESRLMLVFQRGQGAFTHDFVIRRIRM